MSRRLSLQLKNSKKSKTKVKFSDELIFLESIKDNDIESVRAMLRRASANIDLNKINDSGLTAMHQAVLENSIELVKLLIESKADLNVMDEDSWTPLHAAASMGFHEVVKILLENGADANFMTAENERAIDLVDQDDFPLISLLLKYMNATILNDDQNESFDEMDTIFLYKRLFLNILRSCDDTENVNQELEKMVDQKYFQSNILRKALTMAICDICVLKNELDKHELKKKLDILLKYIKNSIDCELNLIRAVYDFIKISEYSIDLFKKIIICFNDLKLISNSAYQMWRSKEKDLEKKKFGFSLKY